MATRFRNVDEGFFGSESKAEKLHHAVQQFERAKKVAAQELAALSDPKLVRKGIVDEMVTKIKAIPKPVDRSIGRIGAAAERLRAEFEMAVMCRRIDINVIVRETREKLDEILGNLAERRGHIEARLAEYKTEVEEALKVVQRTFPTSIQVGSRKFNFTAWYEQSMRVVSAAKERPLRKKERDYLRCVEADVKDKLATAEKLRARERAEVSREKARARKRPTQYKGRGTTRV